MPRMDPALLIAEIDAELEAATLAGILQNDEDSESDEPGLLEWAHGGHNSEWEGGPFDSGVTHYAGDYAGDFYYRRRDSARGSLFTQLHEHDYYATKFDVFASGSRIRGRKFMDGPYRQLREMD